MITVVSIVAGALLIFVWMAREPLPGLRDLAATIRAFFGWPW